MHKYKQYTRLFVFSIIAFIFLFPIIYLIVFSVFHSDTGFSLMNYYKVFLAKPDYLIKFWRSLAMCLMIAAGQTLFSCMSGTAFAKYSFPLKKFWFILFALFMILPIQVTLLPNYILLEKLKLLNSWKALIIPAIFSPFGTVWLTFRFPGNSQILHLMPQDGWRKSATNDSLHYSSKFKTCRYHIIYISIYRKLEYG